jgi:hypothetical protein
MQQHEGRTQRNAHEEARNDPTLSLSRMRAHFHARPSRYTQQDISAERNPRSLYDLQSRQFPRRHQPPPVIALWSCRQPGHDFALACGASRSHDLPPLARERTKTLQAAADHPHHQALSPLGLRIRLSPRETVFPAQRDSGRSPHRRHPLRSACRFSGPDSSHSPRRPLSTRGRRTLLTTGARIPGP